MVDRRDFKLWFLFLGRWIFTDVFDVCVRFVASPTMTTCWAAPITRKKCLTLLTLVALSRPHWIMFTCWESANAVAFLWMEIKALAWAIQRLATVFCIVGAVRASAKTERVILDDTAWLRLTSPIFVYNIF